MKTQLIAVALVSVTAALSSPAFAEDASPFGAQSDGRSHVAAHVQRTGAFARVYNHVEPAWFSEGRIGAGAFDRSRPGSIDPDLRPSAN